MQSRGNFGTVKGADAAGRKNSSGRSDGRRKSLSRLSIKQELRWRCAYVLVPKTYATAPAGAFPRAPTTSSHQAGVPQSRCSSRRILAGRHHQLGSPIWIQVGAPTWIQVGDVDQLGSEHEAGFTPKCRAAGVTERKQKAHSSRDGNPLVGGRDFVGHVRGIPVRGGHYRFP